jgi:hypothetical protein
MKSILSNLALALITSSAFTGTLQGQEATIAGKTDIQALIEAAPGLPASTAEAATRAYGPDVRMHEMPVELDTVYGPFFNRAAAAHKQLKEAMQARAKSMPAKATVEMQARAQANSNPIVAGMGGIDAIQKMTPEQRKQAALQSVAAFQASLATGGSRTQARSSNDIAAANAFRNELNQMLQKIAKVDADFAQLDQAITNAPGSHEQIAQEISAKMANIPFVELGEYGRDRDPVQAMALLREQATRDRGRAAWELGQRTALHSWRKGQYKRLASEYDAWLKQNMGRINTSMADPLRNTNTEMAVLGYEDGLISLSETLAKYTEETTKDAARYERQYQDKMSNATAARTKRPTKTRS